MNKGVTYFLGSGNLQMARLDSSGNPLGFSDPANATRLELNVETETKEVKSRMRDTFGQTLASATQITDATVAMTFNGITPDLFASVFLGDLVDITDSGGTVTDEAVTAYLDKWSAVSKPGSGISAVTVTNSDGTVTYEQGTDYEVDAAAGMIKPLSSGAIGEGASLLVDYTYGALSGSKITGATQPKVDVAIIFSGKNVYTGESSRVEVFQASIRPSSAVDFLSEETQELQFEGKMITPEGKSWPFEVL